VILTSVLILGGGLYPQPGVSSRYNAAARLVEQRQQRLSELAHAAETVSARARADHSSR
jgi:NADH-quinone oxidoreductase subunit M